MQHSKHQTQSMPLTALLWCGIWLGLVCMSWEGAHAQEPSDWLSHLNPDEARSHSEAFDEYVTDVLANGSMEALKQLAIMASMSQDWAVAAAAAAKVRLDHKDYDAVALELAAWLALGDQASAQETLTAILSAPPAMWTGWERLPDLVWSQHDPQQTLLLLNERETDSLSDDQKMWLLEAKARLMVKLNDLEQAQALLGELLAEAPTEQRVMWAVRWARSAGRPELALSFLDQWPRVSLWENHSAADSRAAGSGDEWPIWRAELLQELGRSEEALEVLLVTPPTPEVLFYRARMALAMGRDALANAAWEALPPLIEGIELSSEEAYYTAHLAQLLGHFGQAWVWFGAVEDPPWVYEALLARGLLLNQLAKSDGVARWVGSLSDVREGLGRVRQEANEGMAEQAWAVEALLLRQANQTQALLRLLDDALAMDPNNHFLLYLRALEAAHLNDLELAEQDLRRIIQEDPEHADALNALGYLLADQTTRYREAYQLIHRALRLKPESPEILDSMGWVNYRLGRTAEALSYLEKAYALSQDPEIQSHLAEVLMANGQQERAEALMSGSP